VRIAGLTLEVQGAVESGATPLLGNAAARYAAALGIPVTASRQPPKPLGSEAV
jgi:hypothetical protein